MYCPLANSWFRLWLVSLPHQWSWFLVWEWDYVCTCVHHKSTKVIQIKTHPYWVSISLITYTSPLTAITFYQVSPNPIAVPKPISLHVKTRLQRIFSKKTDSNQNESKGQSTLVMTFETNFTSCMKVVQIVRHEVDHAQSIIWLSTKGWIKIWWKLTFWLWSHTTYNDETDYGWMSKQTLCKNQVLYKSMRVRYFLWFDMEWPIRLLSV